jgi:sterol desaturase/sphingolipid hydroxylase (fatty acid hydroxylase superfamily)
MAILIYIAAFVALAVGFTALERALARRRQPVVRPDYATDLLHVVLSNSAPAAAVEAIGYAALATLSPSYSLGLMAAQPLWLQLVVLLALTDLTFYLVHRALHAVPALWRLHRIHHSPAQMDWLSGYRKHALETVLHSAVALAPVAVLGFSPTAWLAFGVIGVFFAGFTHLNITTGLRWLEPLLVTPRYHAWHHSTDADEQRHNLAGKLALLDWVFGTRRRPTAAAWPETLGLDQPAPTAWWPTTLRRMPRAERSSR